MHTALWLALIVLAAVGVAVYFAKNQSREPPPTAEVTAADVVQVVQAAGIVVPRVQLDVGAQVNGQIRAVHVELGQTVTAGQLLVSIDPDTARSEVRVAEAALVEQKAQIKVRRVVLHYAKKEAERQRQLMTAGATTQSTVEHAESDVGRLEAELRGQTASLDRFAAELTKHTLALSQTAIKAPIDGVVVDIPVAQGQTVNASQTTPVMVTLAKLDEMTVRTRVAEADISKVKVGQQARFVALSGDAQSFEGQVRVIQPVPERSGSASFYSVLFEVPNSGRVLLPQMTVLVRIQTGQATKVATIPVVALNERQAGARHVVYVLGADNHSERRIVKTGLQDESKVHVIEGLKAGEKVLLSPPENEQRRATPERAIAP